MPRMPLLILGLLFGGVSLGAEPPARALLHFIPEEAKILGFCDVERLREGEFLPAGMFDVLERRIYADQVLGRDGGPAPALPCRKLRAVVLAGARGALQGVALFRCEGLDRQLLHRDLEAGDNTRKIEPTEIPGLVIYHRKDPPGRRRDGLSGLLLTQLGLPSEAWVAALDDQTLILSTRDVSDVIRAARLLKSPVQPVPHARLRPALDRLDLESDLAGLALSGEVIPTQVAWIIPGHLKPLFHPMEHVAVTVRGTDPTRVRVYATAEHADHAKELERCLEHQFASWRGKSDPVKWVLAAYGVGRLVGITDSVPDSLREMGELALVATDAAQRLEVRRNEKLVEVRAKLEAREIAVFLRVVRPHLPSAR